MEVYDMLTLSAEQPQDVTSFPSRGIHLIWNLTHVITHSSSSDPEQA
ncbi:MAG: hypothetical protein GY839_16890 [candidate division Zixibacteria bacterium]|nr:hypothetical protein [candidate division Zixibacteria bacterium]